MSLWRFNDVRWLVFDVMVTFNDVRLRCFVYIRYERHKCMRFSALQLDLRGYSCTITMMEQWKDLKAATAFQILCVYFKQISVEKKKNYSLTASCLKI